MTKTLDVVPLDRREAARFYRGDLGLEVRGLAARHLSRTVVAGGIVLGTDGRHWGFLDFRPGYQTRLMLKHIRKFLEQLKAEGAPAVYVTREDSFPTSQRLLERCGFTKTDETLDGREVWKWQ